MFGRFLKDVLKIFVVVDDDNAPSDLKKGSSTGERSWRRWWVQRYSNVVLEAAPEEETMRSKEPAVEV